MNKPQPKRVDEFERILRAVSENLNRRFESGERFVSADSFEESVRDEIQVIIEDTSFSMHDKRNSQTFPDLVLGNFGIEVKFTRNDSWRSVANSVSEGSRAEGVRHIYLLYGKQGGTPAVKWGHYEQCIMHVRTSHVPRFEVEMFPDQNLFDKMGIDYFSFSESSMEEKMLHIREYARSRLKPGESLWWLPSGDEDDRSIPIQARLYPSLDAKEKRALRAEAALLCPEIVRGSRARGKYDRAGLYLLTHHGVMCSQLRDLFTAGSVAKPKVSDQGKPFMQLALIDIETEMKQAALYLDDELFVEHWGISVPPGDRVLEWLILADREAGDNWVPSQILFQPD